MEIPSVAASEQALPGPRLNPGLGRHWSRFGKCGLLDALTRVGPPQLV